VLITNNVNNVWNKTNAYCTTFNVSNCTVNSSSILKTPYLKHFKSLKRLKKSYFRNNLSTCQNFNVLFKTVQSSTFIQKSFNAIFKIFLKAGYNKTTKQKSPIYLTYLFVYFLLTHDLDLFLKKIVIFLQNTDRQFQFKLVRIFKLFNQPHFKSIFRFFKVSGLYFKISGKFGGVGGSKKLRKNVVIFRPKFSDRTLKIQRAVHYV